MRQVLFVQVLFLQLSRIRPKLSETSFVRSSVIFNYHLFGLNLGRQVLFVQVLFLQVSPIPPELSETSFVRSSVIFYISATWLSLKEDNFRALSFC